ncbi:MAG: DNA/RNA non-specific endonuclease, partial [Lachnospiraceae bacterium]|nr:DNA/RNA non-specific endonuclease [Lachnospiraceae bacterium]
ELFDELFADDFDNCDVDTNNDDNVQEDGEKEDIDFTEDYPPNSTVSKGGNTYDTDDNGKIYKVNGIELLPNSEYEIDGNKYKTDEKGRIISVVAYPKSTPEGERDIKAQERAGGEDRRENDQGGHILARILGGYKGIENMVAMWEKVNTGPYKKMENEIVNAVKAGKNVKMEVNIEYEGDSERPSKITVKYTIDGKETTVVFDNDEGSIDLMNELQDVADEEAYQDIKDEIQDAKEDGEEVSVLSVKVEYDEEGNPENIVVCIRYGGENHYRNVSPKQEV